MDVCELSRLPSYRPPRYNIRPLMQHRLHIRPARKLTPPLLRNRVLYAVLALTLIACGLLWRSGLIPLPPVVSKYGGDALWALMVLSVWGFCYPGPPRGSSPCWR